MADKKDLKYIVRILNTDLDGKKSIYMALTKIKGVKFNLANAICKVMGLDPNEKIGAIDDASVKKIESFMKNEVAASVPAWLLNRRKDIETGKDMHLFKTDLDYMKDNDIKLMMKTKSYKGLRHSWGLPVRGQRMQSNFRFSKKKRSMAKKAMTRSKK